MLATEDSEPCAWQLLTGRQSIIVSASEQFTVSYFLVLRPCVNLIGMHSDTTTVHGPRNQIEGCNSCYSMCWKSYCTQTRHKA